MAQYARVPMPSPADPMASLGEMMQMVSRLRSMEYGRRDQDYQDRTRAQAQTDRQAVDTALSPQTAQATQEGYTGPPGGWQGPVDARTPPKPLSRDQVLNSLPGHLRPVVAKQFDEADENGRKAQTSILQLQDAHRKATTDVNEHLAGLGYSVAQFNYGPEATTLAIQQARDTYKNDPEILKRIDAFDQQVQADPAQIKPLVNAMIGQSPRYAAMLEKQGNKSISDLANEAANSPDPAVRAEAQKTLDKMVEFDRAKAPPKVENLTEYEQYEATAARDRFHTTRETLTTPQKNAIRRDWSSLNRAPKEDDATKAATLTQRAQAERWKADELSKLEKEFSERQPQAPKVLAGEVQPMSVADLNAAKARIQTSYLQQIGDRSGASRAAPKYRVGQTVTLKGGTQYVIKEVSPDGQSFR